MSSDHREPPTPAAWQSYWSNQQQQPAYAAQGRLAMIVGNHWQAVIRQLASDANFRPSRVLEVAAGNGHLSQQVAHQLALLGYFPEQRVACDFAPAATHQLGLAEGLVSVQCDAAKLPFADRTFDLVASQFGVEYAGLDAMRELGRITRPHGNVALLLHHGKGALFSENQAILEAVEEFIQSHLLEHFASLARQPERSGAQTGFIAAVKAAESVLHKHGREIAAGALLHLYREVAAMHGNLTRYDPNAVASWCAKSSDALAAYRQRTRWMIEAALDESALERATSMLKLEGLDLISATPVVDGGRQNCPVAWSVLARRRAHADAAHP